jgi:dihydrofolate reductase
MGVHIIVSMTEDRVIGRDGKLPWHIPEDLKHFQEMTTGNVVIMGRKTWDSIPEKNRPLKNRENIVITNHGLDLGFNKPHVYTCKGFAEALMFSGEYFGHEKQAFVIGGVHFYRQALQIADYLDVSHIALPYHGDTYFPEVNWGEWKQIYEKIYHEFTYKKYARVHLEK